MGGGGEVRALRDVASDQTVEVLVASPLLGVVRLGAEHVDVDRSGQFVVPGDLSTLVPSESAPHGDRDRFEELDKASQHGGGVVSFGEVAEQVESTGALHQRRDRRGVLRSDDVGSSRSALPAFELVGFSGPPAEPDVRLSPHPALHRFMLLVRVFLPS